MANVTSFIASRIKFSTAFIFTILAALLLSLTIATPVHALEAGVSENYASFADIATSAQAQESNDSAAKWNVRSQMGMVALAQETNNSAALTSDAQIAVERLAGDDAIKTNLETIKADI